MSRNTEKNKKKKIIFIIILCIIIAIISMIIGIKIASKQQGPSTGGVSLEIDKNAGEYVKPTTDNDAQSKNVAIPGWGSLTIPANQTEVTVDFKNPEENEGLYYLTFELRILNNSEQGYEVLYTSGLVEPGLYIQNITLARELEKGTYDAVVHVQPYRMDENKTPTNNADMQTKLIVK